MRDSDLVHFFEEGTKLKTPFEITPTLKWIGHLPEADTADLVAGIEFVSEKLEFVKEWVMKSSKMLVRDSMTKFSKSCLDSKENF